VSTWADWLAFAAVLAAVATFIVAIVAAYLGAQFATQTFLRVGRHEVSKLREGWKERLRWNIAGLLELSEQYKAADDERERAILRVKIARRAARTKLMLTPIKHASIEDEVNKLIKSVGLETDSSLITVSRPVLKETWEQIEDEFLDRKRSKKE